MKSVDDLTSRLIVLMFLFLFFFWGVGVKFHTLPKKKKLEISKVLGFFSLRARKVVLQSMSFWIHGVF